MCNICDNSLKYFFEDSSQTCILCSGAGGSITSSSLFVFAQVCLVFLGVLVLFGACTYLASKNPNNIALNARLDALKVLVKQLSYVYEHSIKTKMVLWAVQMQIVVEISSNCSVTFPTAIGKTLAKFSVMNIQFTRYLALPCWESSGDDGFDYIDDMVYMTMMPLAFFATLVLLYEGHRFVIRKFFTDEKAAKAQSRRRGYRDKVLKVPPALIPKFSSLEIDTLKRVFGYMDVDHDGNMDSTELHLIIKRTWNEYEDETVDRASVSILSELEIEEGKTLSFQKFIEVCAKQKESDEYGKSDFSVLIKKLEVAVHEQRQSRLVQIALIVSFTILIGTSASIFNFFKCVKYDTVTVLVLDYAVDCESTRYKSFIAYAIVMIIIYPIGIPASYAAMLWTHRQTVSSEAAMAIDKANGYPETRDILFLVEAYKPEFYYFEVVECARRIFLGSLIASLGGTESVAPATTGLIVSMGCIGLFARMNPYKHETDNNASAMLAYCLSLFFLAALMLKSEAMDTDETAPAVLLFFVFGAGPTYIVAGALLEIGPLWVKGGLEDIEFEMSDLPTVMAIQHADDPDSDSGGSAAKSFDKSSISKGSPRATKEKKSVSPRATKEGKSGSMAKPPPAAPFQDPEPARTQLRPLKQASFKAAPSPKPAGKIAAPPNFPNSLASPRPQAELPQAVAPSYSGYQDVIVKLPHNAVAGMVITVQMGANGGLAQFSVPPGTPPGSTIKVRLQVPNAATI